MTTITLKELLTQRERVDEKRALEQKLEQERLENEKYLLFSKQIAERLEPKKLKHHIIDYNKYEVYLFNLSLSESRFIDRWNKQDKFSL